MGGPSALTSTSDSRSRFPEAARRGGPTGPPRLRPLPVARRKVASAFARCRTIRLTLADHTKLDSRRPREVARDSIFGWTRPVGVNGLVRVGVPLASVRSVARRQVNRWATVALNAPWVALTVAAVVVAYELREWGGIGLPIQDAP